MEAGLDQVKRKNWTGVFEQAGGMLQTWGRVRKVSSRLSAPGSSSGSL